MCLVGPKLSTYMAYFLSSRSQRAAATSWLQFANNGAHGHTDTLNTTLKQHNKAISKVGYVFQ